MRPTRPSVAAAPRRSARERGSRRPSRRSPSRPRWPPRPRRRRSRARASCRCGASSARTRTFGTGGEGREGGRGGERLHERGGAATLGRSGGAPGRSPPLGARGPLWRLRRSRHSRGSAARPPTTRSGPGAPAGQRAPCACHTHAPRHRGANRASARALPARRLRRSPDLQTCARSSRGVARLRTGPHGSSSPRHPARRGWRWTRAAPRGAPRRVRRPARGAAGAASESDPTSAAPA